MHVTDDMRNNALDEAADATRIIVIADGVDHQLWRRLAAQRHLTLTVCTPTEALAEDMAGAAVLVDALPHRAAATSIAHASARSGDRIIQLAPSYDQAQLRARITRAPSHTPNPLDRPDRGDTPEYAIEKRLSERRLAHLEHAHVIATAAVQALRDAGWTLTPPATDTPTSQD